MKTFKLLLLGFGNVGQALARLLLEKRSELEQRYSIRFLVTAVATRTHGRALNPDGLDENTPVNYNDGQPAISYIETALKNNMQAITANKGTVVHGYSYLQALAAEHGVKFFFESTVMDGVPIFSSFRQLPVMGLTSIWGILNATTNLVLSRLEAGDSFDEAVRYSQEIGIAETDPSGDIDGWDAAVKVAALITVLMDHPFTPDMVERTGIRSITPEMIAKAKAEGKRYKLVAHAWKEGEKIKARVSPELVSSNSILYNINGTTTIVQFESDVLGKLSFIEEDLGPRTTAYGLLADFVNAVRE